MKLAALGLMAFLLVGTAFAHHSPIVFDRTKQVTITGTVTEFRWGNPHSWIHIDVVGADGKTVPWMIEAGTPNTMVRRGFTRDSLKAGAEIVVQGFLSKDGENRANGFSITFTDGRRLFVGGSAPGTPN